MYCLKCGASWTTGNEKPIISCCPVCDTDYNDEIEYRGYDSIREFLLCMIHEQGSEVCKNTLQITGLLNDYFPQETAIREQICSLLNNGLGEAVYQYIENPAEQIDISEIVKKSNVSLSLQSLVDMVEYLASRKPEIASPIDTAEFYLNQAAGLQSNAYKEIALAKANKIRPQGDSLRKQADLLFSSGKNRDAILVLEKAAGVNDEDALLMLTEIFETGERASIDYKRAFSYLKRLEDNGSNEGMYQIGWYYYLGYGVEKNVNQAIQYFTKAAEDNNERALYALYKILYQSNANTALNYLRRAVDLKHIPAMYDMAIHLLYGDNVTKNINMAVKLLEECAANNNKSAISKLAYMYMVGYEVSVDKEKAQKYKMLLGGK